MIPLTNLKLRKYSRQIVEFRCSCGMIFRTMWKNYTIGHTKTCGKCWLQYLLDKPKHGKLTLLDKLDRCAKTHDKARWLCDCGNTKEIALGSVAKGLTTSCGCHRTRAMIGNCDKRNKNLVPLQSVNRIYGDLVLTDQRDILIHPRTEDPVEFTCKCGTVCMIPLGRVVRNNRTSCGACHKIAIENGSKFGHVVVTENILINGLYSDQKIKCRCSCGNSCEKRYEHLLKTKSCGRCYEIGIKWWDGKESLVIGGTSKKDDKYSLNYLLSYFDKSFLEPQEGANSTRSQIDFKCRLCGRIFTTKLTWVWHSKIVSCGCVTGRTSSINTKLGSRIGADEYEAKIGGYSYDIRAGDLLIECHGLRYHSTEFGDTRKIDRLKMAVARENGYRYIMFFEDEIEKSLNKCVSLVLHKLGLTPKSKLRPQKLTYKLVTYEEVGDFYDQYHYIGKASAKYHIAAFNGDELVAAMSIRKPTRQNAGDWEISRMVSKYTIRGLWSYVIKHHVVGLLSGTVVSYSDNRLFDGVVYASVGFTKAGSIKQDYYWVKNSKRYHKSALRKPPGCTITETELRQNEEYHKIYDLGKTKWVMRL